MSIVMEVPLVVRAVSITVVGGNVALSILVAVNGST
jgi:hypothetical protein